MTSTIKDALKIVAKFAAVAIAAYAGSMQSASTPLFAVLTALGLWLQLFTVSGWTKADLVKTTLKLAGQIAATVAGMLQATQPQLAAMLLAIGAALPALTVPAPGTFSKIVRAAAASDPPKGP